MKTLALILTVLSVPLAVFGYWGTSTADGRAKYDEMDGLYPTGAGLLAIILFGAAVTLVLLEGHLKTPEMKEAVTDVQVVGK